MCAVEWAAQALAAVAFLEAAGGQSIEKKKKSEGEGKTHEYMICGQRADGSQDDLLRFARFTLSALAPEHHSIYTRKTLSEKINVREAILKRAATYYEKLARAVSDASSVLRMHPSSQEVCPFICSMHSIASRCACAVLSCLRCLDLTVHLSVCLSVCLLVSLSIYLSVRLSVNQYVHPPDDLSV